jgi:hypothetical protein
MHRVTRRLSYLRFHTVSTSSVQVKIRFLFQRDQLVLLTMESTRTFTPHRTVLCDHCILTLVLATNVSKQYTTLWLHVSMAAIRGVRSAELRTTFLYLSPKFKAPNRVQNKSIQTCFSEVLSSTCYASNLAPALRMYL